MLTYTKTEIEGIKIPKYFYLVEQIKRCTEKIALVSWFTEMERPVLKSFPKNLRGADFVKVEGEVETISYLCSFPIVHVENKTEVDVTDLTKVNPLDHFYLYGTINIDSKHAELVRIGDDSTEPPFKMIEEFYIEDGMIDNYHGPQMLTDVGKFFLNYLLFVNPFGDKIPYYNDVFVPSKIDNMVAAEVTKGTVGRKEYDKYMNNGYWFGEDGSLYTQGLSEKSLGTSDEILKRKHELLTKYKDQLHDPLVITKIENELVEMDKAYMKGDESEPFYMAAGKKAFKEQRKKMYIMFGTMSDFGSSDVKFTETSMQEGFKPKDIPNVANEVRRGSYGRGILTALGGAESKFILRVFQDTKIIQNDCGSKRGIDVTLTDTNYKNYADRYLVDGTCLTVDTIKKYIGKTVKVRSPMTCLTKGGLCYKCCGKLFEDLHLENIGMQTLGIAESMIGVAMSSMHKSSVSTVKIDNILDFIKKC